MLIIKVVAVGLEWTCEKASLGKNVTHHQTRSNPGLENFNDGI